MHSSTPPLPSGVPLSKESYKSVKAGRQANNSNMGLLYGGNNTVGPSPSGGGLFPNAKPSSKVSIKPQLCFFFNKSVINIHFGE